MSTSWSGFSPVTQNWFEATFDRPTPVQEESWRSIAGGHHTLMCAPTGSGKTLAAFLWCLDTLVTEPSPEPGERCRVLYISPLRALAVDVDRNLRAPLRGIALAGERLGIPVPELTTAIRSGDTPAAERRDIARRPPDLLITTPESLFLMLTSAVRSILSSVRWVIVDEIHAMAATKRGAHLTVSLERLTELSRVEPQRIGLSATQRPLEEIARFLGGVERKVTIIDVGPRKELRITVEVTYEEQGGPEKRVRLRSGSAAAMGLDAGTPRSTVWPAVYQRILELIREHRSTIVFVNSRRQAERVAGQINELAGEDLAGAHHGSIAREQRLAVEDALKAGRLPALIATSSLELGIDMGAVDLVIQVESPGSVARGIQRIGRAGHSVDAPSYGTILPKHRGDLLECAVVVERMLRGEVEETRVPRTPLDVLAQHIVSMCALDQWEVSDLRRIVMRAYPYADLGERAFLAVLDMLSGRYPSEEFSDLRPRIVWDRTEDVIRGRRGSQHLAVVSGGTIPDRGLYTVNLLDDRRRVGELDEEMVYETHPGDTFVLGATTWRVAEITPSQVLVTPAPGEPGTVAFWHGDAPSRPVEVGRAMGQLVRELQREPYETASQRLTTGSCFNERAASTLLAYLAEQKAATGSVPDDRTIVVERFRDQLGDWRVCVLSPLGARIFAPWSMVVEARFRERLGVEVQSIYTNDGFALRIPDVEQPPDVSELFIDPELLREAVVERLSESALFASRFRENAARALLLPRRRPGQRTPLWQQRQRSHGLLTVASRYSDFPIVAETYRECLADVFDLDQLRNVLRGIQRREIRIVEVETDKASPFTGGLLLAYVAEYMYDGDAPLAERRAQALTLDRDLLAELLGDDDVGDLLDPEVMATVECDLQRIDDVLQDPDQLIDVLVRLGDLSRSECLDRGAREEWIEDLQGDRRILAIPICGEVRWIAAEDAGMYRDALGFQPPTGIPTAFLTEHPEALAELVRRYARTHGPFTGEVLAGRWDIPVEQVETELHCLVAAKRLLTGSFGASGLDYCHPEVLTRIRQRALAQLRHEIEPVSPEALVRFLPAWHGIGSTVGGIDRLAEVVEQLEGAAIPMSALERDVLSERVHEYEPDMLDELISSGEIIWVGRGPLGPRDGRVALYRRDKAPLLLADLTDLPSGELHDAIRERLRQGACFFPDLVAVRRGSGQEVLDALWDLVWSGEVTNDTMAPLRSFGVKTHKHTARRRRRSLSSWPARSAGRWSSVSDLRCTPGVSSSARSHLQTHPRVSATEILAARASMLLERHGVLVREAANGEGLPGGFSGLYPVLRQMEESGKVRRGYFIDGLGGSQFALPGAVDRLRSGGEEGVVVLSSVDPANPFGITVPWPGSSVRMMRSAGSYVVLAAGRLELYLERGAHALWSNDNPSGEAIQALKSVAARLGRLEITRINEEPAATSPLRPSLLAGGFVPSVRGVVFFPSNEALREYHKPAYA